MRDRNISAPRGSLPITRAAIDWLDSALPGLCAPTDIGGNCSTDNKGSFEIRDSEALFSWLELTERCLKRCLGCERGP